MPVEIKISPSRNPNYVTFSIDQDLIPLGTGLTYSDPESAESNPLAKSLFAIGGVESVWILGSGIHVTKDEKTRWSKIQSRIIETIRRAANSN
jgi:hypothetical protein